MHMTTHFRGDSCAHACVLQAKRAGKTEPTAVSDDVAKLLSKMLQKLDSRSWTYSETTLKMALQVQLVRA
jgi:hypothetical protein